MSLRDNDQSSLLTHDDARLTFKVVLQIVKYSNIVFSLTAGSILFSLGYYETVKEYMQICFLAILMSIIDSDPGWLRNIHFVAVCLLSVAWNATAVYTQTWQYPPITTVCLLMCAVSYMAGSITCTYVIVIRPVTAALPNIRFVDLDLLIYLIALNVLCIIPVKNYNLALHMILDIRMLVLLFTGLYRPLDKIELLHDKTFLAVLLAIICFFVLFTTSVNYIMYCMAYLVNVTIGSVLFYQAYYHYYVRYPELNEQNKKEKEGEMQNMENESFSIMQS
ncbi:hypothetical protein EON65_46500 [archaeon]|nr:MAG: hypothetical protein EON65_46500 [archaeon]